MSEQKHLDDATLNEFLDNSIDPDRMLTIEAHLSGCNVCTDRLQKMRAMFLVLEGINELSLERDLAQGVLSAISKAKTKNLQVSWKTPPGLSWLFAFQVLSAMLLILSFWQNIAGKLLSEIANIFQEPQEMVVSWLMGLASGLWISWQQTVLNLITQTASLWKGFTQAPAWLPTSIAEMVVLTVSAAVLWFVGNGLLFRSNIRNSRIRRML